jgi:hypothetical protein
MTRERKRLGVTLVCPNGRIYSHENRGEVSARHPSPWLSRLLAALVEASEREGTRTSQAGIFPENVMSIALFERAAFRRVGRREKLGAMDGRSSDVARLERRSKVAGV